MNKPNREENKQAAKILEWEKLKFQNYISPNEIKTIAGMDCLYYIKDGIKMGVLKTDDPHEVLGVNTPAQLTQAEQQCR